MDADRLLVQTGDCSDQEEDGVLDEEEEGEDDGGERPSTSESNQLIELLPHEHALMLDTIDDDVLFITARGVGLERLFAHHLHAYASRRTLVLVVNTRTEDDAYFSCLLSRYGTQPRLINSEVGVQERMATYRAGGVQFVTSRILCVDLLSNRVPVQLVAGILVYRAHSLLSSFLEHFILRLYREKKPDGFVKAFSNVPSAFVGIGTLQRAVSRLFVRRVRLLPRFDVELKADLEKAAPRVVELYVAAAPRLRSALSNMTSMLAVCLRELKASTQRGSLDSAVEEETLAPWAALAPTMLERQLKMEQSRQSDRQKKLLQDLDTLRALIRHAEHQDPAGLLADLTELRADVEATKNSFWMMTPTAARLFADVDALCPPLEASATSDSMSAPTKWKALSEALREIKQQLVEEDRPSSSQSRPVLIVANGADSAKQIASLCRNGADHVVWQCRRELLERTSSDASELPNEPRRTPLWNAHNVTVAFSNKNWENVLSGMQKEQRKTQQKEQRKKRKLEDELGNMNASTDGKRQTTLTCYGIKHFKKRTPDVGTASDGNDGRTQVGPTSLAKENDGDGDDGDDDDKGSAAPPFPEIDSAAGRPQLPPLIVVPWNEHVSCLYSFLQLLDEQKPAHIVLYHTTIGLIRHIEIWNATSSDSNPENADRARCSIYLVMYKASSEEQRYLSSIDREQTAFTQLLRHQATLLVPREWQTERAQSSLITNEADNNTPRPQVIVDMREFNAELPTVLYTEGVDVIPATLEVADYVLSDDVAVERKALDDLAASLQSGRVHKQIEQMARHYERVVLLVESSARFERRLVNGGPFQGELSRHCRELRNQLVQVVRASPELCLIWTTHPQLTAELFLKMKQHRADPSLERALRLKSDELGEQSDGQNKGDAQPATTVGKPHAVLLRQLSQALPNMPPGDTRILMTGTRIKTVAELLTADEDTLHEATGAANRPRADFLYTLFNADLSKPVH